MQRWDLASADSRDALRRYFRKAVDEALDALVEMHQALHAAQEARGAAVKSGTVTQAHEEAVRLHELEAYLAAAMAVDARTCLLDFEKQAEAAVAAQPWPEVTP